MILLPRLQSRFSYVLHSASLVSMFKQVTFVRCVVCVISDRISLQMHFKYYAQQVGESENDL